MAAAVVLALFFAAVAQAAGPSEKCVDTDSEMREVTQQQIGQALTCEQYLLGLGDFKACDDRFIRRLCCAGCQLLLQQYRVWRKQQVQELEDRAGRVRAQLEGAGGVNARFRSLPLHGRGAGMPLLGLGTSGLDEERGADMLDFALKAGYRHLDTALMYDNHDAVSQGLRQSGVPREEVFITSKVPPEMMGFRRATEAVERIRAELPGGYADLCLVHWPHSEAPEAAAAASSGGGRPSAEWAAVERAGAWRALEEAFDAGTCRAIGVSNYMVKHLAELRRYARIAPSVNQLEYSPLAPLSDLVDYCRQHSIVLQAFGWRREEVLGSAAVKDAAAALGRTPSQVLLLWFLQRGHVPLYMSARMERILEHAESLSGPDLSEAQLVSIEQQPALQDYAWRYYDSDNAPWNTPVMGDAAGCRSATPAETPAETSPATRVQGARTGDSEAQEPGRDEGVIVPPMRGPFAGMTDGAEVVAARREAVANAHGSRIFPPEWGLTPEPDGRPPPSLADVRRWTVPAALRPEQCAELVREFEAAATIPGRAFVSKRHTEYLLPEQHPVLVALRSRLRQVLRAAGQRVPLHHESAVVRRYIAGSGIDSHTDNSYFDESIQSRYLSAQDPGQAQAAGGTRWTLVHGLFRAWTLDVPLAANHTGGEVHFFGPKEDVWSPSHLGDGVFFDAGPLNAHKVEPTSGGKRYVLLYWLHSEPWGASPAVSSAYQAYTALAVRQNNEGGEEPEFKHARRNLCRRIAQFHLGAPVCNGQLVVGKWDA